MKRVYTVSKVKDSDKWYAHKVGFSNCPCMIDGRHTFGTKKEALNNAAIMMGIPYKEYMKLERG